MTHNVIMFRFFESKKLKEKIFDGFEVLLNPKSDGSWTAYFADIPKIQAQHKNASFAVLYLFRKWYSIKEEHRKNNEPIPIPNFKNDYPENIKLSLTPFAYEKLYDEAKKKKKFFDDLISEKINKLVLKKHCPEFEFEKVEKLNDNFFKIHYSDKDKKNKIELIFTTNNLKTEIMTYKKLYGITKIDNTIVKEFFLSSIINKIVQNFIEYQIYRNWDGCGLFICQCEIISQKTFDIFSGNKLPNNECDFLILIKDFE